MHNPIEAFDYQMKRFPKSKNTDDYICILCGYIYYYSEGEEDFGVPPKTSFSDLGRYEFQCPVCGCDDFKILSKDNADINTHYGEEGDPLMDYVNSKEETNNVNPIKGGESH